MTAEISLFKLSSCDVLYCAVGPSYCYPVAYVCWNELIRISNDRINCVERLH